MARIVEIQKKSAQWMASFSENVINIIEENNQQTVDFNRSQLLNSSDSDGKPLIHNRTGSDKLSPAYARRTGKSKPNIFETGEYQKAMFLTMPDTKQYFITSDDEKVKYLPGNYNRLHGVSPENRPKAQKINNELVINDYLNKVLR